MLKDIYTNLFKNMLTAECTLFTENGQIFCGLMAIRDASCSQILIKLQIYWQSFGSNIAMLNYSP